MPAMVAKGQPLVHVADMTPAYGSSMLDVAASLSTALAAKRSGLDDAAFAVARAQSAGGGAPQQGAMAQVAERAIFEEALLSAVHARLEEVKSVTKA